MGDHSTPPPLREVHNVDSDTLHAGEACEIAGIEGDQLGNPVRAHPCGQTGIVRGTAQHLVRLGDHGLATLVAPYAAALFSSLSTNESPADQS